MMAHVFLDAVQKFVSGRAGEAEDLAGAVFDQFAQFGKENWGRVFTLHIAMSKVKIRPLFPTQQAPTLPRQLLQKKVPALRGEAG
jgi:hypothetical protein